MAVLLGQQEVPGYTTRIIAKPLFIPIDLPARVRITPKLRLGDPIEFLRSDPSKLQ